MSEKSSSIHYINYLALDKILDAQNLVSKNKEEEAHEEMLFVIIHQTYELWFKQILHELTSVMSLFQANKIDESNIGVIVNRMDRVNKIMTTLIGQINILETMTALDLDGVSMTLDINQIGSSNIFRFCSNSSSRE